MKIVFTHKKQTYTFEVKYRKGRKTATMHCVTYPEWGKKICNIDSIATTHMNYVGGLLFKKLDRCLISNEAKQWIEWHENAQALTECGEALEATNSQSIIATIINVCGKSKSVYGHPTYFVLFSQECYETEYMEGHTASDAECNYCGIKDLKGKKCQITYHETPKGAIIIEKIEPIKG